MLGTQLSILPYLSCRSAIVALASNRSSISRMVCSTNFKLSESNYAAERDASSFANFITSCFSCSNLSAKALTFRISALDSKITFKSLDRRWASPAPWLPFRGCINQFRCNPIQVFGILRKFLLISFLQIHMQLTTDTKPRPQRILTQIP